MKLEIDRLTKRYYVEREGRDVLALSDVLRVAMGSTATSTAAGLAGTDPLSSTILLTVWGAVAVGLAALTFRWE